MCATLLFAPLYSYYDMYVHIVSYLTYGLICTYYYCCLNCCGQVSYCLFYSTYPFLSYHMSIICSCHQIIRPHPCFMALIEISRSQPVSCKSKTPSLCIRSPMLRSYSHTTVCRPTAEPSSHTPSRFSSSTTFVISVNSSHPLGSLPNFS